MQKKRMNIFRLALAMLFIVSTVFAQSKKSGTFKFYGEYGLYVQDRNDSLVVHWMTVEPDSGYLRVLKDEKLLNAFSTAAAGTHRIAFKKPGKKQLILEYGAIRNGRDNNRTMIYRTGNLKQEKSTFSKADSVFVVGDVHGRFDELVQVLQNARVIDADLRWIAGKAHLVMLGDLFDRGKDVTRVLWLLYRLEQEAKQQKGYVHLVLGNHEIMTMANDLRYLSGKENLIASNYGTTYDKLFNVNESLLGKWLGSKPAIIKIGKILFAHGGVAPNYAHYSIDAYNDSLYAFLREPVFYDLMADSTVVARYDSQYYENRLRFFFGSLSPFWFRGYVQTDTLGRFLDGVLDRYDTALHVVAHTPVPTITELYGGKLIAVDLYKAATEILLLVRAKKGKYRRFKYDLEGKKVAL